MKVLATCLGLLFLGIMLSAQEVITWSSPLDLTDTSYGNQYPRVVPGTGTEAYVTWGGSDEIYFSKISDVGVSEPMQLNNEETVAYVGHWTGADMAARGDSIYVTFMHANWGRETFLVRSFDAGASFSEPIALESYADSASRFPSVAIMPDGNPIVTFMKMTADGAHPDYVVRRSNDFGESYLPEQLIGDFSGQESEACDCCPGALVTRGEDIAVLYRDNLDDVRDIWATTSQNGGEDFDNGFAVDNAGWVINGCPSTGPDAIILGNRIFTVFHSDGQCYISKAGLDGGIFSYDALGEESEEEKSQNYPRICADGDGGAAIVWKDNTGDPKLFLSYTSSLNTANPEYEHHLLYEGDFSSADVAIAGSKIYVVMQDASGAVKYIPGQLDIATGLESSAEHNFALYPNPTRDLLHIDTKGSADSFVLRSLDGSLILKGVLEKTVDLSSVKAGTYLVQLLKDENIIHSQKIAVE